MFRNILHFQILSFGLGIITSTMGRRYLSCLSKELRMKVLYCPVARLNAALMFAFYVIPFSEPSAIMVSSFPVLKGHDIVNTFLCHDISDKCSLTIGIHILQYHNTTESIERCSWKRNISSNEQLLCNGFLPEKILNVSAPYWAHHVAGCTNVGPAYSRRFSLG